MADEISDDELESILGGLPSEDDLPEAEEPADEEIEEIDENIGEVAEDAPGVTPDDVEGDPEPNGEPDIEIEEDISVDDFGGEIGEGSPSRRPLPKPDTVVHDEERQNRLINEARKAGVSEEDAKEGIRILDEIERAESLKSQIGFAQADNMRVLIDQKVWEMFNYNSFGAFFNESEVPISRSAAYRYRDVALFMDDFPIGEAEFDDRFYEESGIDKKEVVDSETGEVDEDRTREANSLRSRLNFTDVNEIAGMYNNGHIDQAKAKELLKKALILPGTDFDEVLDMEKDGKDSTITEDLTERGLVGPTFVVNAQNEENAIEELRDLADQLEEGRQFSRRVLDGDEGVEKLGSKSVSFHELQDGTILGDI